MGNGDCVSFLQWCLPRMGLRWPGYRRVRGTVCKRLRRRMAELALPGLAAYRAVLEGSPEEWTRLEALCRIPISRFWRDRWVFDWLAGTGLPELAARARERRARTLRLWSAGCASGEEAYSLRIAWAAGAEADFPDIDLAIVATDADPTMIARAKSGRYREGSLRALPAAWRECAFLRQGDEFVVGAPFRRGIRFRLANMRRVQPAGPFDLILCRNVAFTYFDAAAQQAVLKMLVSRLRPGGFVVIGGHEHLPRNGSGLEAVGSLPVFRRPHDAISPPRAI